MYYSQSELTLLQAQFPNAKTLFWQSFFHPYFTAEYLETRPMTLQFLFLFGFFFFSFFFFGDTVLFQKLNVCSLFFFFFHNLIYTLLYFMGCENCTSWYIFWNYMYWLEDLLTYQPLNNYILRWGNCTRLKCSSKWYSDNLLNTLMLVCVHIWCEKLVTEAVR